MSDVRSYDLTPAEQAVMRAFNQSALQAKARIHDLLLSLDKERAELAGTEKAFNGALTVIAGSRGLSAATISPDLTKIISTEQV